MNEWDLLGYKWHVDREGLPYAIAYADNQSDTFDGLGIKVGLDTIDYKKWAHTTDSSPVKCKKYKIPNVIVYHIGESKYYWPFSYYDSALLDANRSSFERSALEDEKMGFYVMSQRNVSDADILSSLKGGLLYRYLYSGHGDNGVINTVGGAGVASTQAGKRLTKHGINLLVVFSCASLGEPGEPPAPHARFSAWEWNVAKRGALYGYRGSPSYLTEIFHWRFVGQGSNFRR